VVPMRKIEQVWPSAHWLGWTSQLQGKTLPLPVPQAVVTRVVASPYRQGGKVYRSQLRLGVRGSDSVWNLQRALIRKGFQTGLPSPTGDYLSGTRSAVAAFQRSQGWAGRDADGLAGRFTVVRLGLIWVQD
jgi:peptidoglycan hydrolase-like protein with peptidoglycan-binding domain